MATLELWFDYLRGEGLSIDLTKEQTKRLKALYEKYPNIEPQVMTDIEF